MSTAGCPAALASAHSTSITTGSWAAASAFSRILRKTWIEPERVAGASQVRVAPFSEQDVPPNPARREASHASRSEVADPAGSAVQDDRRGIASHLLIEAMQVVLGLLDTGHQARAPGPVLELGGEQLEAKLTVLKRVASLVGQAGGHLADAASRSAWTARCWASFRGVMSVETPAIA